MTNNPTYSLPCGCTADTPCPELAGELAEIEHARDLLVGHAPTDPARDTIRAAVSPILTRVWESHRENGAGRRGGFSSGFGPGFAGGVGA